MFSRSWKPLVQSENFYYVLSGGQILTGKEKNKQTNKKSSLSPWVKGSRRKYLGLLQNVGKSGD